MNSASIDLSDPRIIICGVAVVAATLTDLFLIKRHLIRWLLWTAVFIPLAFIVEPISDQDNLFLSTAERAVFGVVLAGVLVLRGVVSDALRGLRRDRPIDD